VHLLVFTNKRTKYKQFSRQIGVLRRHAHKKATHETKKPQKHMIFEVFWHLARVFIA
jgi:hypothetical protein